MKVTLKSNSSYGLTGTNYIGAKSVFDCTVLPQDVSFYRVEFRENIPGENYIWPDGTSGNRSADIVLWNVGYDNKITDTVASGLNPIRRLHDGINYVDFTYTVRVPEEYKNEFGEWIKWLGGEKHPKKYRGSDQKAKVSIEASNTATGEWMGPWK